MRTKTVGCLEQPFQPMIWRPQVGLQGNSREFGTQFAAGIIRRVAADFYCGHDRRGRRFANHEHSEKTTACCPLPERITPIGCNRLNSSPIRADTKVN